MNLGVRLLRKLGLTESEENRLHSSHHANHVFARDLQGIGYTGPKSVLPDLDDAFARLNAIAAMTPNQAPKIEIKPVQSPFFIPSKLKKKDINSFSNEDLSSIFIQSNITHISDESEESNHTSTEKRRRRKPHREPDETSIQQQNEETAVPTAHQDSFQQPEESTQESKENPEATEVQHRRRRRKHKTDQ